jgi:hypothetical protein
VFAANFYARRDQKRKKSCSLTKTNFIKLLRTAFAPAALRITPVGKRQKKHRKFMRAQLFTLVVVAFTFSCIQRVLRFLSERTFPEHIYPESSLPESLHNKHFTQK